MGRKPGFFSLFSATRYTSHASSPPTPLPWPWPSCSHPRTRSFREKDGVVVDCVGTKSSESSCGDAVEAVIRGLRSDRLFFEPGATSSIVEAADVGAVPFEGSIAMAVESEDPYRDFKQSMEEMLTAHGVIDWAWLEEMLVWYLTANGKKTHELIIGAFVDLLVSLASSSSSSSSPPSSSDSS
ncbi:unnamed protein product [Musa acuminata subsp. malaccensis]|uniref:Transcription repressor n=1 Tax=Musa acuminata subsp. malaccensis TaxID=214687 RepID=A0A804LBJ8_MUSAM|nr:PREDICTED: transcription repressor OFP13-like [Musa acuminata subsp. malaccensis]CAG1865570.1 unnamed protein product [Musa acuminata subsp. malaccensis]